jgi:putative ABC transport system permease protein
MLNRIIALRSLAARRLRTGLTIGAIILGVAGMYAITATNQNAYRSITQLFAGTTGRVNLEVRAAADVGGIPEDILADIRAVPGVDTAVPVLTLAAILPEDVPEEIDISFFGPGSGGLILYGIDPILDPDIRDYSVLSGEFLPETAEDITGIMLVETYAADHEIKLGDSVDLLVGNGLEEFLVVGLLSREGAALTNNGRFGLLRLADAQRLMEREGELDRVDVVAADDQQSAGELTALRDELLAVLGTDYAVQFPASQGERMAQMLSGYQIGLNFLAGIALFVGIFLIYNAFSMTIAERTRELGLLRAVGMVRSQIMGQVLLEGLILGVLGSGLGGLAGIYLSRGLVDIMAQVVGQPLDSGAILPDVLLMSILLGIGVTLLAAFLPAYGAGRISPLEALRSRSRSDQGWLVRYGWIPGLLLLGISAYVLIQNPFPYDVQFRLGSLTVFALFFGATLIIPATVSVWQFLTGWFFRLLFGPLGEMGTRNLQRAKSRTMLTCAALLVGVAMIVVIQGMTASFTRDLFNWMDAYIGGDAFVGAPVPLMGDFQVDLEAIDGVETATPIRYLEVTWLPEADAEEKITLMAVDPASYTQVTRFVFNDPDADKEGAVERLQAGEALFISGVIAEKYGLETGDTVTLKTREGDQAFTVAGIVLDFFNQGLVMTGTRADLEKYYDITDVTTFLLQTKEGVPVADTIDRVLAELGDDHQLIVESNAAIKERALSLMGQAFSMFDVLGVMAVLVAALGIVNTLSMSVLERTREIGMLRAMGLTRAQTVGMILAESGLLGVIGGLLGLGFGVALTWIFLQAMGAMSGYALDFVLPQRAVWLAVIVALAMSQLAALLPALRAARIPVLRAIQHE